MSKEQMPEPGKPSAADLMAAYDIKALANKTLREAISIAIRTSPNKRRLDPGRINAVLAVLIGMIEKERAKLGAGPSSEATD